MKRKFVMHMVVGGNGHLIGSFHGTDESGALDAMAAAGIHFLQVTPCANFAELCAQRKLTRDNFRVQEVFD